VSSEKIVNRYREAVGQEEELLKDPRQWLG
jgi:hypothetical protein